MDGMTRRQALTAATTGILAGAAPAAAAAQEGRAVSKGRLKQSVSRWCYGKIPMPDFCKAVAGMGLTAIDLLEEADWAVVAGLRTHLFDGLCRRRVDPRRAQRQGQSRRHRQELRATIPKAKAMQVPNVITFFGNRKGMSDEEATANCIEGLNRVKKIAEDNGVTICVELLNSKVDHKDYQGDRTKFGVDDRQGGRVTARETALRHLSHADHGRRSDPHDPRQPRLPRALPHRRGAWTARARRHTGSDMERGRHEDLGEREAGVVRTVAIYRAPTRYSSSSPSRGAS